MVNAAFSPEPGPSGVECSSDFHQGGYYSCEMETKSDAQLLRDEATNGALPGDFAQLNSSFEFGMHGTHSSSLNDPGDIVWDSLVQFAKANHGNLPADVPQLIPYLKRPLDQAKVQEILGSLPPGIKTIEQLKAARSK